MQGGCFNAGIIVQGYSLSGGKSSFAEPEAPAAPKAPARPASVQGLATAHFTLADFPDQRALVSHLASDPFDSLKVSSMHFGACMAHAHSSQHGMYARVASCLMHTWSTRGDGLKHILQATSRLRTRYSFMCVIPRIISDALQQVKRWPKTYSNAKHDGVAHIGALMCSVKVTQIRAGDRVTYPQKGDVLTMHYVGKVRSLASNAKMISCITLAIW
jgi:hypothetical protein